MTSAIFAPPKATPKMRPEWVRTAAGLPTLKSEYEPSGKPPE
jgi:hypothetical protein